MNKTPGADQSPTAGAAEKTDADTGQLSEDAGELLLLLVDEAFLGAMTFVDAYRSGVTLGAEEVQEQRIQVLEDPPDTSAAEDLLSFVMVFALEAPLAGAVAKGLHRTILAALKRRMRMQSRALAERIRAEERLTKLVATTSGKEQRRALDALKKGSAGRLMRYKAAQDRTQKARDELAKVEVDAKLEGLKFKATAGALRIVTGENAPDVAVALAKAAQPKTAQIGAEILEGPAARVQHPTSGLVPPTAQPAAITIRAQLEKDALMQIEELRRYQLSYRQWVRRDLTRTTLPAMEDIFQAEREDIPGIVDHFQFFTAALIWSRVLGLPGLREQRAKDLKEFDDRFERHMKNPKAGMDRFVQPKPYVVGEKHVKYLAARFGEEATRWARESTKGNPQENPVRLGSSRTPPSAASLEKYIEKTKPKTASAIDEVVRVASREPTSDERLYDLVLQWLDNLARQAPQEFLNATSQ